ncbi:FecR family protein [uncultured Lacinutrix sp.]|uniref:FecR family protein n=1 Tax=uncultured Lacinutrix sp. TaxID=574032 RepID=UPI00260AF79E|nr:FecR family protein [uncultured Lacinutrix sp.]
MKKNDDTFLARWLNGDLTPEEENAFKNSKEYIEYQKIIDVSNTLEAPDFDANLLISKIKKETIDKPKVRKLNLPRIISIAASIIVLLGVFFYQNAQNPVYNTSYGEQLSVILPDGSKVVLNANSSLTFNKTSWKKNRNLNLEGEAYFSVKEGSVFKIETKEGRVEVLGTEFNVNSSFNYFEVMCYSGKVNVINKYNTETTLTKGNASRTAIKTEEKWNFNPEDLFWKKGMSSFYKAPFSRVILALENQFNIKIQNSNNFKQERFTGSFSNKDYENALKTVFTAMGIKYTINNDIVLIKN